jgi:ArsR family transcriptional regulator
MVGSMAIGENLLAGDAVCAPGTPLILPQEDLAPLAARLKTLGDATRMRIVQILAANGSVCACDLEEPLGLSQPTVSHHLRQLADAGLVERDKRGTWAFYRIADSELAAVALSLSALPAVR